MASKDRSVLEGAGTLFTSFDQNLNNLACDLAIVAVRTGEVIEGIEIDNKQTGRKRASQGQYTAHQVDSVLSAPASSREPRN